MPKAKLKTKFKTNCLQEETNHLLQLRITAANEVRGKSDILLLGTNWLDILLQRTMSVPKKRYSQDPGEPGPMFVPEKRYSQDPAEHGRKNLKLYLKRIPPTPIKLESRLNATAVCRL